MRIVIRDFAPEDFDILWRIDQECFPPGIAYSRAELLHYINRKASFGIVATAESAIVGFLVGEISRRRKAGHVITIDVTELARRHRVGTLLMAECERRMIEGGCDVIFLESAVDNGAAVAFYERHGFRVLETLPRYYHNNLDAYLMGKKLANEAAAEKSS